MFVNASLNSYKHLYLLISIPKISGYKFFFVYFFIDDKILSKYVLFINKTIFEDSSLVNCLPNSFPISISQDFHMISIKSE